MTKETRIKFGKRLRELRMAKGLSQEKLADLADLGFKYFQTIEGKNPPSIRLDTIDRLAKALNIKIETFFKEKKKGE